MADANSYLVEIFRDGRWVGAGHGVTPLESVDLAKDFIGREGVEGIRVSVRSFDEIERMYRKDYIYRHPEDQDHLISTARRGASKRPGNIFTRHSQSWLLFAAIMVGLLANMTLAFYVGVSSKVETTQFVKDQISDLHSALFERENVKGMVLFNLPTISTNYRTKTRAWILRIDVSLELNSLDDIPVVRARLSPIVESVVGNLSNLAPGALETPGGMSRLQGAVHQDVQSVAGDVHIESVLFRNLILM